MSFFFTKTRPRATGGRTALHFAATDVEAAQAPPCVPPRLRGRPGHPRAPRLPGAVCPCVPAVPRRDYRRPVCRHPAFHRPCMPPPSPSSLFGGGLPFAMSTPTARRSSAIRHASLAVESPLCIRPRNPSSFAFRRLLLKAAAMSGHSVSVTSTVEAARPPCPTLAGLTLLRVERHVALRSRGRPGAHHCRPCARHAATPAVRRSVPAPNPGSVRGWAPWLRLHAGADGIVRYGEDAGTLLDEHARLAFMPGLSSPSCSAGVTSTGTS